MILLTILLACNGCIACQPTLPGTENTRIFKGHSTVGRTFADTKIFDIELVKQDLLNHFNISEFFRAEKDDEGNFDFIHKNEVQKWLDLIRGSHLETTKDNLKLGAKKPAFPFSDTKLLSLLNHTFWFLPNVASCFAMRNLLLEKQNTFYHDYKVIVAAGNKAGLGVKALPPVKAAMLNPLETKTVKFLKENKIKTFNGLDMFMYQGQKSFYLWNKINPEIDEKLIDLLISKLK